MSRSGWRRSATWPQPGHASPAHANPAHTSKERVMQFIPHVIDGEDCESASGARFTSVDPWPREPYAEVALGAAADADRAVRAARRAFDSGPWPRLGLAERGAILNRLADLVEASGDELALADTID